MTAPGERLWAPPGSDGVTVVSLNLRFGLAADGDNAWRRRRHLFPDFFRLCPADFFVMQEVNGFQADDLAPLLSDYTCIGRRQPAPRFWQHNLVWHHASWQCVWRDHFFLSPTPDLPSRYRASRWPRQCTLGVFRRDGRRLAVVGTHFDFRSRVQADSARIVLRRLAGLDADLAVVIAGDFNAPPASAAHRILTGAEVPGDAFEDVFTSPFPATHHGFSGRRDGDHIDWILFRGNLDRRACGVFQQPLDGRFLSDHYPVWAVFAWKDDGVPRRPAPGAG